MSDVLDLVEQSREVLDDVWRQIEFEPSYPQTRMVRLMDVIGRGVNLFKKSFGIWRLLIMFLYVFVCGQGGDLGRYVQRKLSGLKIFAEPFVSVKENLKTGVNICEQWVAACEHLTGQVISVAAESSAPGITHQAERSASVLVVEFLETFHVSQVWKRHAPHPWKGDKHCPQTLQCLARRLDEVRLSINNVLRNKSSCPISMYST